MLDKGKGKDGDLASRVLGFRRDQRDMREGGYDFLKTDYHFKGKAEERGNSTVL